MTNERLDGAARPARHDCIVNGSSGSLGSPVLVSIDTQRDTLDGGPLEIGGTSVAVPAMSRLCAAFRARALPIIHVVRLYMGDGSNAEPIRRQLVSGPTPILRPGTPGRLLAPGLLAEDDVELDDEALLAGDVQLVGPNEFVMYKPRWGAFYGTSLEEHLQALAVDTVVVCGCNFPNCPRTTIYEASERDYRTVLVTDAISGLYDRGEVEMANIGVSLMTVDEVVAELRDHRGSSADTTTPTASGIGVSSVPISSAGPERR